MTRFGNQGIKIMLNATNLETKLKDIFFKRRIRNSKMEILDKEWIVKQQLAKVGERNLHPYKFSLLRTTRLLYTHMQN